MSGDVATPAAGRRRPPRRPRVLMLVLNPVTGDSRVQKVAWSAANAGWDVTLLGTAPSGPRGHREEARLGHARVVRVRVDFPTPARRIRMGLLRRLHRVAVPPATGGGPAVAGPRRWIGRLVWDVLVRDAHWERTQPQLLEAERAFAQVVDEVDPDLLHAHDYTTIAIAVRAAERARRRGRTVRVVYDAHEYLPGVRGHSTVWHRAFSDLERTAVPQVDAVVTVSEGIAELLQERYALPRRPTVVANAPLTSLEENAEESAGGELPSLRERIGLAAEVPLLVYSGAVAPQRGVTTMVEALPLLPDVHAAVVAPAGNRYVKGLLETASGLGVTDRLHVAPYVPPNQVPEYLSSATVGVIPILHYLNHELALVTKYYEYMHARLPIVVSDVKEMAAYTRELGNGEVFAAGDAEALATAVRTVLADRERYAARYGDEVLAAHTWERQVEMLYNVYVALLGVPAGPPLGPRPVRSPGRCFRPPPGTSPVGHSPEWRLMSVRHAGHDPAPPVHVFTPYRSGLPNLRTYLRELWERREFALEMSRTKLRAQHQHLLRPGVAGAQPAAAGPGLLPAGDDPAGGPEDRRRLPGAHHGRAVRLLLLQRLPERRRPSVVGGGRLILNTAFPRRCCRWPRCRPPAVPADAGRLRRAPPGHAGSRLSWAMLLACRSSWCCSRSSRPGWLADLRGRAGLLPRHARASCPTSCGSGSTSRRSCGSPSRRRPEPQAASATFNPLFSILGKLDEAGPRTARPGSSAMWCWPRRAGRWPSCLSGRMFSSPREREFAVRTRGARARRGARCRTCT